MCMMCERARQASSSDMQRLHDAFSVLMTSLRFGSAAYLAGDTDRAKRVFTEAASLFARLGYGFFGFGFLGFCSVGWLRGQRGSYSRQPEPTDTHAPSDIFALPCFKNTTFKGLNRPSPTHTLDSASVTIAAMSAGARSPSRISARC
jgi:hypothetical protein